MHYISLYISVYIYILLEVVPGTMHYIILYLTLLYILHCWDTQNSVLLLDVDQNTGVLGDKLQNCFLCGGGQGAGVGVETNG